MKLQAELNAERPARERSRLGQRPPVRNTRTGGRSNGRVKYTYSDVIFPSLPAPSTLLLRGPKVIHVRVVLHGVKRHVKHSQ